MRARQLLTLEPLRKGEDGALLLMRLNVGAFLAWGVWDNVTSAEHMQKFESFLAAHGFVYPQLLAPFDVALQLICGLAIAAGLLTRWAGVLCALNFVIAIVMVDHLSGWRGSFPSSCLVVIGLYLAARGAGAFSLDRMLFPADRRLGRRP
jgi:putative oxidoreductase